MASGMQRRAELTEQQEAERAALIERHRLQREEDQRLTNEHREANYEASAGSGKTYVGVSSIPGGGVELEIVEWTSPQADVALTREQALHLITELQRLVR